jgi:hypothetical protein
MQGRTNIIKYFTTIAFTLFFVEPIYLQNVEIYYDSGQSLSEVEEQVSLIKAQSQINFSNKKNLNNSNSSGAERNQNNLSETLETTFNNNNGYSGNYFQVDVLKSGGITVSSMAGNFGTTGGAGVWVRDGAIGNAPGTGWTQVASATISGTSKQNFSTNFTLAQGTYTMFFANTGGANNVSSLNYTNGTGVGNVAAQNSDLKIYEGYGTSDISPNTGNWSGNGYGFSPRVWNGSITYAAATPTIVSSSLSLDNNYLDITLSESIYNTNGGSGALEVSDFNLTFAQNNGNATAASISSIKKNDNASEGSSTSLSGGETIIRIFLNISGTPSGVETITITPTNGSSIYNASGQAMGSSESTGAKTLKDKAPPTITAISIASDNSTIAVTMSEAVYNTNGGSGGLEASDLTFTISGGTASLSSATPTSISSNGNVYTLGLGISGTPTGAEVITVNPVDNGIYDALGNESITSQSNNSVNLKDKAPPTITAISIASDNSAIYITISEAIYNTSNGSGALENTDFKLSISGGSASLSSSYPGEISNNGNVYTLSLILSGTANGSEVLKVSFLDNSIYDAGGNEGDTAQNNNTIALKDKTSPIISSISLASDNSAISVTFSEAVYNSTSGSGNLEMSDFSFSISGGVATLSNSSPSSLLKNSNVYKLGLSISGAPNGQETITINPKDDGIYDLVGNEASTSQNNNNITLNDKVLPVISSSLVDGSNNFIDITMSESVYANTNANAPILISDLAITFNQNNGNASSVSINSLKKNDNTAQGSASALTGGESVIRVFLNINSTPSGVETISISPIDGSSIFDKVGNVMLASNTTGLKNLKDQLLPSISSVFLSADNSTISITMSEGVFNTNGGSGNLEVSDFVFSISGGTASLSSTTPSSIAINGNIFTLGIALSGSVNGKEELVINPSSNSIYDASGNEAISSQSNNVVDLYDEVVPVILSTSLASDNTTVSVTFSEAVFNAAGGSGSLEASDFSFSLSGGVALLGSVTPTSISSSSNVYTLGINISNNPNGYELLVVNPKDDSIYDSDNNEASTSQSNNSINLNDNSVPAVSSISSISANGTYGIGNVVQITTIFNEEVFVTGTPQITLETGSTDAVINYAIGSGSNTLVFNYIVAEGDTATNLDYKSTSSLVLNNGSIKDVAGNSASLTLASPSSTNSLGANKSIIIDGNTPTVRLLTSTKSNGYYGINDTIPISVSFTQIIVVTGTPQLTLETGNIDGLANYVSGNGTKNIIFNYIIGSGQNTGDLDYTNTSALKLNDGALKDSSGNAAKLTLPATAATSSLGANKDLIVDTNGPIVLSVSSDKNDGAYNVSETINIIVTFSDTVYVTGTPILLLETGEIDAFIDFSTGSGTNSMVFRYIINSNHNVKKLKYKTSSSLVLYGGSINDKVNNPATLTLPNPGELNSLSKNRNITIDNISPQVNSVYEGENKNIEFINSIDSLSIFWTTQLDTLSGIDSYELALGTTMGDSNKVNWLKIDSLSYSYNSSTILKNLNLEDSFSYYASVRAVDKAGNVSSVIKGDGVTVDLLPPIVGSVNDGISIDLDYTATKDTFLGNWSGFSDPVSGIIDYHYAIGTTLNGADVKSWVSNGLDTSFTYTGYELINSQVYYISVKAIDKIGNISDTISSNGIISDQENPNVGLVVDGIDGDMVFVNTDSIYASWSDFADSLSGISHYEYAIGTSRDSLDVIPWTDNNNVNYIVLGDLLKDGNSYYISVRAVDKVGNISEIASSNGLVADFTSPSIISISLEDGGLLPYFDDAEIYFTLSEPIVFATAKVESKIGDTINDSLFLNINTGEDLISPIKVMISNPFTSADKISIKISELTDKAGNVSNDLVYEYDVSLLGDYDLDGNISVTDLNTFINGWITGDIGLELGPTIGTVPNLKLEANGIYDIYDAMAFTRMWHWNTNKSSKQQTKMIADQGAALNASIEPDHIVFNPPKGTQAIEFILDYPASDIQFNIAHEKGMSDEGLALSNVDTLNGRLVYQIGYFEENNQPISISTKHLQKNDLAVNLTFQFIGKDNVILSAGSEVMDITPVPSEFALHDNYPNPFNPVTTINYDLPKDAYVNLIIYDIMGRRVADLSGKEMSAGYQTMTWNARNNAGSLVSAGIYFYQIQTRDFIKTKKMVLLK